jgi:phospholipid/cholesterol/gamma-HCH transport system ATP-binding protein
MSDSLAIRLEDVHKTLGGREILKGISLDILKGETHVIIGRSGSGKSVTLKHIVGLISPDRGKIIIQGTNVSSFSSRQFYTVRKKIGVLFQGAALLNWMTVAENIALPLKEHTRLSRKEIQAKVLEKLAWVELEEAGHKYPSQISGGMAKRVGLARALIRDPEIILYDEPTSGLDPVMSNRISMLMNKVRRELGTTSIVVTHDMHSAYQIADRISMVYQGKIIETGTPQEIRLTRNPYVRQFVEGGAEGPLSVDSYVSF